jgi:nucleotide-binding universal stress UspA family protein
MPKNDPLDWYLQRLEATTYLTEVKTSLGESHVPVEILVREGSAIEQIVDFARTSDVDLVILNSHDEHGRNGRSVSGNVQLLLQRLWISTVITHSDQTPSSKPSAFKYQRLVLPLDGSRRAAVALPIATVLANACKADLLVVRVISRPEMARYMPLSLEDEDLMQRVVERNMQESTAYLDQLRGSLPAKAQTRLLVSDNVAATLQEFCEQVQADLLIMSAHGYSGEARWPYGSVANRFITHTPTPLLIVQDQPHVTGDIIAEEVTNVYRSH